MHDSKISLNWGDVKDIWSEARKGWLQISVFDGAWMWAVQVPSTIHVSLIGSVYCESFVVWTQPYACRHPFQLRRVNASIYTSDSFTEGNPVSELFSAGTPQIIWFTEQSDTISASTSTTYRNRGDCYQQQQPVSRCILGVRPIMYTPRRLNKQ